MQNTGVLSESDNRSGELPQAMKGKESRRVASAYLPH